MSLFQRAVAAVLEREGGYVNDPNDPGGETKYGISKRVYSDLDIRSLSIDDAIVIYKRDYWDRIRGDELPRPVAWCVFDQAVNRGVGAAIRTLQVAVGVQPDGVLGPLTLRACQTADTYGLVEKLQTEAVLAYARLPTFHIYGRGWVRRAIGTAMEAQTA